VAGIQALMKKTPPLDTHTLLDSFKERYEVKRLLDGGRTVEYSAHVIPESGYNGLSKLYGDGILVTGDAAGFALNVGVTVRGMEFAIASGIMAAETIIDAKEKDDFSSKTLSSYEKRLMDTFVLQDLKANKEMPGYLENDDFFAFYPERFSGFLEKIVWFGEGSKERIGKTLWSQLKSSGVFSFRRLRDLYRIKNI